MRKDEIDIRLQHIAFEFFYKFSRFEFALKANGYLQKTTVGKTALPSWKKFANQWYREYVATDEAKQLVDAKPKLQVIAENGELRWECFKTSNYQKELHVVIDALKAVRNNLFHGGKYSADDWDDKERTELLLNLGTNVLDQLAEFTNTQADYTRYY